MGALDRSEMCVLSQAHAVAFAALAGANPVAEAARLSQMSDILPEHHPMRAAVQRFRGVQGVRCVAVDDLAAAARALRHAVDLCLMPPAPGQERVDIHG